MLKSPIIDLDQNYVLLTTNVTIGKSYSSRGWALSRQDIHEWIPVEKFERKCKVLINNICSDAILRFNPRLFYESDELSFYLKELYDTGWSKGKVPMSIKINKNNLFSELDSIEQYLDVNYIETELSVGKSYKSKGWQLSKDVVSKIFPAGEYGDKYSICIENIESKAKLNLQFRLFYKSDNLSEYLEELFHKNPRDKVQAKIIFKITSEDNENFHKEQIINSSSELGVCSVCGKKYEVIVDSLDDNYLSDICLDCIEKVKVLRVYNEIKNASFSNFVKKDSIKEKFGSNFEEIWSLLIKYDFLIPFGDLFKFNGNESIENTYAHYLLGTDSKPHKDYSKRRNRRKILELIDEEEQEFKINLEEPTCIKCGCILGDSNNGVQCESCMDKSLATDYLQKIVTEIPYGGNFSKSDLIDLGVESFESEMYIKKLLNYNLISSNAEDSYKLNDVSFLNDFVKKYSDSPYQLQIGYINDNSNVLKISKDDLNSEEKIDSIVKWKKFSQYISFKKGQYGFVSVHFKQDGRFMYSKGFNSSYEAKLNAIYYLNSLNKIIFIVDGEMRLQFK